MGRARQLTKVLQSYDKDLYATKSADGVISVMRKKWMYDVFEINGSTLLASRPIDQHIFSLTENWSSNGKPVDWGTLPVMNRLRAIDGLRNPGLIEDLIKRYEKAAETKDRDFSNTVESFLYELRPSFKKAFGDVNTSTLEKIDKRRIYDGYR